MLDKDGKVYLDWEDVRRMAVSLWEGIAKRFPIGYVKIYGIPRGGIHVAQAVQSAARQFDRVVDLVINLNEADVYVDDLIDGGTTKLQYQGKPFLVLFYKQPNDKRWVVFPWEQMKVEQGPEENILRILEYIGEDPKREGLIDTPSRVVRSYSELFNGYGKDTASVLTFFEDDTCDEMVIIRNVEFFSTCEHHMLPFFGKAHIAYIPDKRIVGVSKLVRILEIFSRRLQIQERLCQQITEALDTHLQSKGSACVLEAKHLCMTSRGVGKQHTEMVTSSLTGVFREDGNEARNEFLSMIRF